MAAAKKKVVKKAPGKEDRFKSEEESTRKKEVTK